MIHAMIDIESWGVKPGAAIRSIGAALFDPRGLGWTETFYANIDRQSCIDAGLQIERETADWWATQPAEAGLMLVTDTRPLNAVVATFNAWFINHRVTKVWCQGPGFDAPLWKAACEAVGQTVRWKYWDVMCTRTAYHVMNFDPKTVPRVGVAHYALDDCRTQIIAVQSALKMMLT